jgi:hypothetical protein
MCPRGPARVPQFLVTFFRRHANGLQPLRGIAARMGRVAGVGLLAALWFGALPVLAGVSLLLLAHPTRFFPHPILAAEDVMYVWVMGFTLVQFLYRCVMLGMMGDGPMRRTLEHMWVRTVPGRARRWVSGSGSGHGGLGLVSWGGVPISRHPIFSTCAGSGGRPSYVSPTGRCLRPAVGAF